MKYSTTYAVLVQRKLHCPLAGGNQGTVGMVRIFLPGPTRNSAELYAILIITFKPSLTCFGGPQLQP